MVGLSFSPFLSSQEMQSGSIRGKVVDEDGQPLPGVSITISGPRLMGVVNLTTTTEGFFRAPFLTPGSDYEIKAMLSGFETVISKGLIVNVGRTVSIEIQMKPAAIEKEITVVAPTPTVDVVKSQATKTITSDIFASLPMARSLSAALQVVPGTRGSSVHGAGGGENGFVMDGVQMIEPDTGGGLLGGDTPMAWDMIEEVEVVTAGAPAESYSSVGGLINVVTKSGGNEFSGEASVYYTNKSLTQVLLPAESLKSLGLSEPSLPVYDVNSSFSLGGAIIKDKIWFMGEFRYLNSKYSGDFKPTVINGVQYDSYDRTWPAYVGFLKISAQLAKNLRFFAMGNFSTQDVPYYYMGWNLSAAANKHNTPVRFNYSGTLSWMINSTTILDIRAGGLYFDWSGVNTKEADPNGPYFIDDYTGYLWGNTGPDEYTYKPKLYSSITLTRFQDNFLGGNHEIKAGLDVERDRGDWGFYMKDPLFWHYYNENPYYYRGLFGIDHPDPVYGDGLFEFLAIGTTRGSSYFSGISVRFGGFVQDSFTIKRLTANLGLRMDTMKAWVPGYTKGAASDPVTLAIGATYFVPKFGFNPYDKAKYDTLENVFPYGVFISPHIGLTYDLFGNGKTALKASFVRQQDAIVISSFSPMDVWPSFTFNWWDLNNNGKPDLPSIDKYDFFGGSPQLMSKMYSYPLDPNIKLPYQDEISFGIEHELAKDLNVSLRYISKDRKRSMANVLYDQPSNRYWYTYDRAPNWWVPFTTTVPAYGDYPAKNVTMYFQSKDAPAQVFRLANIPESKSKFHSYELSFDKRMSSGWQLGGSISFSKLTGNYPISFAAWQAYGSVFSSPNYLVNRDGELPNSRPIMIRLYGSFKFPYDFILSFFYRHFDGVPWGRTVRVVPPGDWAAAHSAETWSYSIQVETPGTRRDQPTESLDFRLEKDFKLGPGQLGVSVDIFNVLGSYRISTVYNPAGTWRPADADTTEGTYTPGWTGLTGISGSRLFKFSILYRF